MLAIKGTANPRPCGAEEFEVTDEFGGTVGSVWNRPDVINGWGYRLDRNVGTFPTREATLREMGRAHRTFLVGKVVQGFAKAAGFQTDDGRPDVEGYLNRLTSETIETPEGWGEDGLSKVLEAIRNNTLVTFQRSPADYDRLRDIEQLYNDFVENWRDPSDLPAAMFAYRAHSAFLAAVQLAMCGQVPESFMVMRGCLENALYGAHVFENPTRWDVWRNRGNSDEARCACSREFSPRNIFPELRTRNASIGVAAGDLYERTINYGAHPNEAGHFSSLTIEDSEGEVGFDWAYLTGGTLAHQFALRLGAQVGVVTLDIFSMLFPGQVVSRNLTQRLESIRLGL